MKTISFPQYFYCPQTKFAKVMFIHLSVILFTAGGGGVSRPRPRGEVGGLPGGVSRPRPGGMYLSMH